MNIKLPINFSNVANMIAVSIYQKSIDQVMKKSFTIETFQNAQIDFGRLITIASTLKPISC